MNPDSSAQTLPQAEILSALDTVLTSDSFKSSSRHRDILRFIVTETVMGRQDRLKGYSIATLALGKGDDFDPVSNSIVRVAFQRLRQTLEMYYATEGKTDPVRIVTPKGTYVPAFERRATNDQPARNRGVHGRIGCGMRVPIVAIAPSRVFGGGVHLGEYGEALEMEVTTALRRFEEILVTPATQGEASDIDFVLELRLVGSGDQARIGVTLCYAPSGPYAWSQTYPVTQGDIASFAKLDDIAGRIATAIAAPFGHMHRSRALAIENQPVSALTAYECALRNQIYFSNASKPNFDLALAAARRAVELHPTCAFNHAMLADMLCEDYRMIYSGYHASAGSLRAARYHAETAIRLCPDSAYANLAMSCIEFTTGRSDEGVSFGDQAMGLNPNNPMIASRYGQYRAYDGDWRAGARLVEKAMTAQPGPLDYQIYVLAERDYMAGDFEGSLRHLKSLDNKTIAFQPMFKAANYAQLGDWEEARHKVEKMYRIDPGFDLEIHRALHKRDVTTAFVDHFADGLRMAGVPRSEAPA